MEKTYIWRIRTDDGSFHTRVKPLSKLIDEFGENFKIICKFSQITKSTKV